MFTERKLDCLFPASTATMNDVEHVIQSIPVHITQTFIFSALPYTSVVEFHGKAVAVQHGLSLGAIREKFPANFVELPTVEGMIIMLKAGRIDAFVAYEIDALASYRKQDLMIDFYLKTSPMHTAEEAFVCHDTPENQQFIQRVNRDIGRLQESGKLGDILSMPQ